MAEETSLGTADHATLETSLNAAEEHPPARSAQLSEAASAPALAQASAEAELAAAARADAPAPAPAPAQAQAQALSRADPASSVASTAGRPSASLRSSDHAHFQRALSRFPFPSPRSLSRLQTLLRAQTRPGPTPRLCLRLRLRSHPLLRTRLQKKAPPVDAAKDGLSPAGAEAGAEAGAAGAAGGKPKMARWRGKKEIVVGRQAVRRPRVGGQSGTWNLTLGGAGKDNQQQQQQQQKQQATMQFTNRFNVGKKLGEGGYGLVYNNSERLRVVMEMCEAGNLHEHLAARIELIRQERGSFGSIGGFFGSSGGGGGGGGGIGGSSAAEAAAEGDRRAGAHGGRGPWAGGLPENEAAVLFKQLVEGIAFCHRRRVLHRDAAFSRQ
ncbi:hypothetical protein CLOM_g8412 [Closterium sp. NIES-68]|nr:hypothetical protein CLOM_g8412 [Closterium sp. NIES-68]